MTSTSSFPSAAPDGAAMMHLGPGEPSAAPDLIDQLYSVLADKLPAALDRSSLHQLSFALLRRFHIIRVEAPAAGEVEKVIQTAMKRASDDLLLEQVAYRLTRKGKRANSLELDLALPELKELFARDLTKRRDRSYTDLVQERVVGLATVQDIVRFIAEGIRGPSQGRDAAQVTTDHIGDEHGTLADHARATCASFLAIALALSVFPQLDALTAEARRDAVKHIIDVFCPKGEKPTLMRRIEAAEPGADAGLKLALIQHTEPTEYDLDDDKQGDGARGASRVGDSFRAGDGLRDHRGRARARGAPWSPHSWLRRMCSAHASHFLSFRQAGRLAPKLTPNSFAAPGVTLPSSGNYPSGACLRRSRAPRPSRTTHVALEPTSTRMPSPLYDTASDNGDSGARPPPCVVASANSDGHRLSAGGTFGGLSTRSQGMT